MQVLLKANKEGRSGHKVGMHVRVVGSSSKAPGQTVTHYEEVLLAA